MLSVLKATSFIILLLVVVIIVVYLLVSCTFVYVCSGQLPLSFFACLLYAVVCVFRAEKNSVHVAHLHGSSMFKACVIFLGATHCGYSVNTYSQIMYV